jgi:hypothetical protein
VLRVRISGTGTPISENTYLRLFFNTLIAARHAGNSTLLFFWRGFVILARRLQQKYSTEE